MKIRCQNIKTKRSPLGGGFMETCKKIINEQRVGSGDCSNMQGEGSWMAIKRNTKWNDMTKVLNKFPNPSIYTLMENNS
jgi:hypothetical protein